MVDRAGELPSTIQLWRSLTQWNGGTGLTLLMLTMLNPDIDGGDLFGAELSEPLVNNTGEVARRVWGIYVTRTVFSIGLLALSGMPLWESLNLGMSGIAIGGFTVTDKSFSAYGRAEQAAAMVIMLFGAIGFAAWRDAFLERPPLGFLRRSPC